MLSEIEIKTRWADGESYNRYIAGELGSFRKAAWKTVLRRHLGEGTALDILDMGTGPGFFACILAEEGHRVTGIDSSAGMLARAAEHAERLGVAPTLLEMDANAMTFPDDSFDAVVTRNVIWTLARPELVYAECKRILRPGGRLLVYDANWHMHYFDEELMERVRARERRHLEVYGEREVVCNDDWEYYSALPLSRTARPRWDAAVLTRLGFSVAVREDLGEAVYTRWEKDLYGESPLFEVSAVKGGMPEEKARVHRYWQKRAATFGFLSGEDSVAGWQARIQKHLPPGRLRVLDVGTGPGFLAAVTAMLGHQVTGVDLCSAMIARARENAEASGLSIDFLCTDAGELPFEDDTFDVVISRNLVWALTNPEEVLLQWRRVLKPGGLLLYFDGNHYLYLFDQAARKAREAYVALTGNPHRDDPGTVDYSEMDSAALSLPLSRFDRPHGWDEQALPRLGFELAAIETDRPQDRLGSGAAEGYYTSFLVAAKKSGMSGG